MKRSLAKTALATVFIISASCARYIEYDVEAAPKYKMTCMDLTDGWDRCENEEVICYRFVEGISCAFKSNTERRLYLGGTSPEERFWE